MANRKAQVSKAAYPVSPGPRKIAAGAAAVSVPVRAEEVPSASDRPATCGMLGHVRTELVHRIEQSRLDLRAEMQQLKGGLQIEMQEMKVELRAEMHQIKIELKAEIHEVKADLDEVKGDVKELKVGLCSVQADIQGLKADVTRVLYLVEEQNTRNKTTLDALVAVLQRQDRVENRMDVVEATVRDLASARHP